jgi:hypothetical protein
MMTFCAEAVVVVWNVPRLMKETQPLFVCTLWREALGTNR